ncbi:4-(cytidine 5'-diphospho)-2-C-methyl-D-erythritol kinase [Azospirillum halopraeferens]|uniref:4-(cytidine 5'-diphospho)-2-C-methyl-D-erythritol kinase n=1 Tax=Azospirillum halopraeferens TaxID=34010 RepID=UPI00042534EF|nr:4-(cytidine 5'-diphospho)-2-C-methyl-D-erythritol kinase [Azospirillum halopraeferens]
MPAVTQAAPAKLNLYLHVLGRRDDGYHELDSLAVFADAGDTVTVQPAPARVALRGAGLPPAGPRLAVSGPFAPVLLGENPAHNLVNRAAHALAARLGRDADVMIHLEKRLPVASGIGGGSADAAATLRALARLWEVPFDDPRLYEVAVTLGADVPVCLAGRPAFMGGIGERLDAAPALPACHAVLANPGVAVPTPAVFRARRGPFSAPARFAHAPADAAALAALLAERRNDLAEPALTVAPVIADVLAALDATDGCLLARLSGSGATGFGLYATAARAQAAAATLAARQPGWWVTAARLLPVPDDAPPLPHGLTVPDRTVTAVPPPPVPFPDTGGWGVG